MAYELLLRHVIKYHEISLILMMESEVGGELKGQRLSLITNRQGTGKTGT